MMQTRLVSAGSVGAVLCACAFAGTDPCPGIAFDEDDQFFDLPGTGTPHSVTAGDIDLDGDLDLIVGMAELAVKDAFVFINRGDGTFDDPYEIQTNSRTDIVRLVDVSGDGAPDLIGVSTLGACVLLNDGAGGLLAPTYYSLRPGHGELELADLNGDGFLDIAASREVGDGISVLLGDGSGGFGSERFTPGLEHAAGLGIGDLNSDGIPDAVVGLDTEDEVVVAFGDGTGFFTIQYVLPGGDFPASAEVVDIDRDGHNDAVVRQFFAPGFIIYFGDGSGLLTSSQELNVGGGTSLWTDSIGLGDLDLDGNTDIVTGTIIEGVTVLLGRDDGSFLPVRSYGGQGAGASSVAVADLNGDGLPDVASTQTNLPGALRIVLNECDVLCSGSDVARPHGVQDAGDITTFADLFLRRNPVADLNRDDTLDLLDIVEFVTGYASGCDDGDGD